MNQRPVRLTVSDDLRRGHGSVFFRVWFALPFVLWLALWAIAAFFVAIVNWSATLAMGRPPSPAPLPRPVCQVCDPRLRLLQPR